MNDYLLLGLTCIFLLGFIAQWIGWRFHIPGILLLLGFGLIAGPGLEHFGLPYLDVVGIFGDDLIFPVVGMGVAIILFEGGLTLNFRELKESGGTIIRLISVGALVSFGLASWFAHGILGFSWSTAFLFGAILVITGPTVIGPMLRQIRPKGKINYILKWEGILNDPVGAILGVLILEVILLGQDAGDQFSVIAGGIGITLLTGVVLGGLGALLLVVAMRKAWIPDYLHIPATLSVVLVSYAISDKIQHESGLLTVTLMGILLANQRSFPVKHILEFKENLQVLLIAGLFIVLGARVELEALAQTGWQSVLFLVLMILVVRPATILVSTIPSGLNWKERLFLMLMAPRGIVVTVLASLFAFRLTDAGIEDGERMFAETLFVILGTVLFYGFAAGVAAKKLGLSNSNPQGMLFVGAHPWARMVGAALKKHGIETAYIDSNPANVKAAQEAGLKAYCGNIHSEEFLEEIDFSSIGSVLAITANDEINAFAERELAHYVGLTRVFKLAPEGSKQTQTEGEPSPQASNTERVSRSLFGKGITFNAVEKRFYSGATVKAITLREGFNYKDFAGTYGLHSLPLFILTENRQIQVVSEGNPIKPAEGTTLICLDWAPEGELAPTGGGTEPEKKA